MDPIENRKSKIENNSPLDPAHFDLGSTLWLMHCSEGPVPRASAEAVKALLEKELRPWELKWEADFLGIPQACREAAARVIGARWEDISLSANTSAALQMVALGFPFGAGDEVVAPLGEFPSNAYPWKALAARGVTFREVPLWEGHRAGPEAWASAPPDATADPETRLLDALGERTKVLALSWVRFQDGLKLDLPRLGRACAGRGVALVVDGIQGAGTHVPDLAGVAAFACGNHKGLLSPQGLGFLWTDPTFRARLLPAGTWLSVAQGTDFSRPSTDFDRPWLADGRGLEPGSPAVMAAAGFGASLDLIAEAGVEEIGGHVRGLQDALLEGLARLPTWAAEAARLRGLWEEDRLGPFLALHHGGRGPEAMQAMLHAGMKRGVYASVREGYLRLAFHGWHGEGDVARVLGWLEGCA